MRQMALMGHTCRGAPAAGVEPLSLKCFRWGMGGGAGVPGTEFTVGTEYPLPWPQVAAT